MTIEPGTSCGPTDQGLSGAGALRRTLPSG
jgi:hypothetical protein